MSGLNNNSKPLNGAVLMIGSLYWETKNNALKPAQGEFRENWRNTFLDMSKAQKVLVPIRYGRRSSGRNWTYTMMFSKSVPRYGEAYLIPYKSQFKADPECKALYEQAVQLARAEGISKENKSDLFKGFGFVAITLTEHLKKNQPEVANQLAILWRRLVGQNIKAGDFQINPEGSLVTSEGFLDVQLTIPEALDDIDFVFSTPVVTEEPRYPTHIQVAQAMMQDKAKYFDYFINNVRHGINTYQDHEIMELLPKDIRLPINFNEVRLDDYRAGLGVVGQLQRDLQFCLSDVLFSASKEMLCKVGLKHLGYGIEKDATQDQVAAICEESLQQFRAKFGNWGHAIHHKDYSVYDRFLYYYLDLSCAPAEEFSRLSELCLLDIQKCDQQSAKYRTFPSITRFEANPYSKGTLEEQMLWEFHQRNLKEKIVIESHVAIGLKVRVLTKCSGNYKILGHHNDPFNWYYDRPYYSAFPKSEKFFDHMKIDTLSHRLRLFKHLENIDVTKLYSEDKDSFYQQLFHQTSIKEIFDDIFFWLDRLTPLIGNRKPVFIELKKGLEHGFFYGCYATLLIQLEGLFTDLIKIADPLSNYAMAGLPLKVQTIRPKFESDFTFYDYCQYQVAKVRNRLMHGAIIDNPETHSYDALTDIWYLLEKIYVHESPAIQLNNLIDRQDMTDFLTEEGFNLFFNLQESLTSEQKLNLKDKIVAFEKNYLSAFIDIEYLALEMHQFIPNTINHWYNTIEAFARNSESYKDIRTLSLEELKTQKKELIKYCRAFYELHYDIFQKIYEYRDFFRRYKIYLPNISDNAMVWLKELEEIHTAELEKIHFVGKLLKPPYNP